MLFHSETLVYIARLVISTFSVDFVSDLFDWPAKEELIRFPPKNYPAVLVK